MKNILVLLCLCFTLVWSSCSNFPPEDATSNGGVEKLNIEVALQSNGQTLEQSNIAERLYRDNLPGSIKHLYVISTLSGQVLLYSTVKGKVTSSGKRLTPSSVNGNGFENAGANNFVTINNTLYITDEVLGDDGTYGGSIDYLYWFDSKGIYHQHYKGGNEMLHISDQPIAVKSVVLNLEER